ncbi:polyisoprenoid-binding protein YceI [Roseibium hamelinense]|uniref:Polyisoprenoid-binding protein YceI n=1 Tax=Roseibium hamelinense TaxID=150831 RepID=A0A562T9U4_9HYPH|nr:YceI family protein [Roseibium hamelinense]MTI42980.1 polyisoprenoid-binding protein [Roseibium hamelinense]TWI89590.1 polyisoprenoid-binding protein YceI [Roseibium hamelinense]
MLRLAASAFALSLLTGTAFAEPVAYEFDKSHSNLSFTYDHLGYSTTDGRFGEWEGTLLIDKDTPANSSIEFTIEIDSMDTFWAERDKHLKSPDFFDAANHPQATFKSTSVEQVGENQLEVTGDLTIKGKTKPATLNVDVTAMGEHPMAKKPAVGFAITTVVKRSDYGMDMFVPYVGDEVSVTFHSETLEAGSETN